MKRKRVLPYSNGSPWFLVTYQKSNLFLGRAVAFLMSMFPGSLYDTDHCYDDTDNRNNNTDDADNRF